MHKKKSYIPKVSILLVLPLIALTTSWGDELPFDSLEYKISGGWLSLRGTISKKGTLVIRHPGQRIKNGYREFEVVSNLSKEQISNLIQLLSKMDIWGIETPYDPMIVPDVRDRQITEMNFRFPSKNKKIVAGTSTPVPRELNDLAYELEKASQFAMHGTDTITVVVDATPLRLIKWPFSSCLEDRLQEIERQLREKYKGYRNPPKPKLTHRYIPFDSLNCGEETRHFMSKRNNWREFCLYSDDVLYLLTSGRDLFYQNKYPVEYWNEHFSFDFSDTQEFGVIVTGQEAQVIKGKLERYETGIYVLDELKDNSLAVRPKAIAGRPLDQN